MEYRSVYQESGYEIGSQSLHYRRDVFKFYLTCEEVIVLKIIITTANRGLDQVLARIYGLV